MIQEKYQTFWRRFFAIFVDGLIFLPLGFVDKWVVSSGVSELPLFLWMVVMSSIGIAYSVGMHGTFGQTFGKMATKVIVLDVSEIKLSYKQAALRDIVPILTWPLNFYVAYQVAFAGVTNEELVQSPVAVAIFASLFGWMVLELVTMLFNNKRRAIHDFIAGSVVIKKSNKSLNTDAGDDDAG